MVLVLAVRRRPRLRLVAGVHVEDARAPAPLSVTLPPPSMTILGPVSLKIFAGLVERDRDRVGAAVERDDAAVRDRVDERARGAARGRAVADDRGRVRDVGRPRLGGDLAAAVRVARGRARLGIRQRIVDRIARPGSPEHASTSVAKANQDERTVEHGDSGQWASRQHRSALSVDRSGHPQLGKVREART